ncbi:unnamed protein product [Symbiodinium sp. CCMP2456]|nr:unnamed protein product [Symbiodinium sp. CCMP2456]
MVDITQTAPGGSDEDEDEGTASDRMLVGNDGGYSYGCCHDGPNTGSAFGLADQFHNAHFQPDVCSFFTHFVLKVTVPVSFLIVWAPIYYRVAQARALGNISRADASRELEEQTSKWRWLRGGLFVPLFVNFSVLAYVFAGSDREQVSLTEVFLPLGFLAAIDLTEAAAFNLASHEAVDVDPLAVGERLEDPFSHLGLDAELTYATRESFVARFRRPCSPMRCKFVWLAWLHDPEVVRHVRKVDLLLQTVHQSQKCCP